MSRAPIAPGPPREASLLDVDVDGALVRLRARYDPGLVEQLKRLPGRRYDPEHTAWLVPARREALGALARLLMDLGDHATLTQRARLRLASHGPGRLERHAEDFEIRAAPRPQRLAKIRALPERRWDPRRRCWRVPATRAGALALRALVDEGELVATPAATARLEQVAAAQPAAGEHTATVASARASPIGHWRHVTRGPVFAANPHRREWVAGVGWCVRVRVDPAQRRSRRAGRPHS